MTVDVRASLRASQLIPRGPEIYSQILTSVALSGFEPVTIGEQT